jgi:transposase InsO family protein
MSVFVRKLALWAVRPKRNTSKRHPEHKVYPYLLRGKAIDRPNQVWAADISYIAMREGFLYLVAIIDWATRRVLSWRLSNALTAGFCVEALSEALARFGKPSIFNADQSLPSRKRGVRNSPVMSSPRCYGIMGSRSAWMDASAPRQHLRRAPVVDGEAGIGLPPHKPELRTSDGARNFAQHLLAKAVERLRRGDY